ncbi:MAG: PilC/PilY family type IV pilus protein, partial [Azonexus sp.]|nr:PilC/PilY family type IV pilus protein [Azonexus sp.]
SGGCSPNPKAVIPAEGSRKIYTSKVVATDTPPTSKFEFNKANLSLMTANQRTLLGSTTTARENVISFIRGTEGISGFRTRPKDPITGAPIILGDIIDGQPAVVSKPAGITTDTDYSAFISANSSRGIVLIGANDGMLHAFNIADMTELMGYVPAAVYPHLKALTATDYGQSAGTPHTFHVNGTLRQQDVKLGSIWKTIVASGLGQGGQGFFAVDATNTSTLASAATVKWEWNDQNDAEMGYSFAAPVIYNVRTSATTVTPVVILANGYNNSYDDTGVGGKKTAADSSALYILNADTGALIRKITVTGGAGLSSPAGVDFGQDGILDYVYAGDINGKMWRFDLTDPDPANFKVLDTPIFDAGPTHPIVMRPAIKPVSTSDGTSRGNLILFGTGKLLTDADRTDATVQSFYAVLDDMSASPPTVDRSQLLERTIDAESSISSGDATLRVGSYRKVSTTPELDLTLTSTTWKGWRLDFPATTERLVTSPMLFDDKLLFGTGITQSTEKCLPGGKGWVMGLDPMTGSVTKSSRGREFSFIDVKLDGKSTDADKVGFLTGSAFVSGFSKDGIPTELTYVAASSKIVTTTSSGGTMGNVGQVVALRDANAMAVYTGNAASGVSSGNSMGRTASTGAGKLYSGTIGDDKVEKETMLGTSFGVKIETSIWREIK